MSEEAGVGVAAPASPAAPAAPEAPAAPVADAGTTPAPAESAPAAPKDGEKSTTDDSTEKRSTRRFERRIDKLTRRAAEAQAKAELLEKELQQYKAPKAESGSPRLEDFKDIEEYANAKAKFEADKVLKEHHAKQQSQAQEKQRETLLKGWEERAERGASKYDDFEETVGDIQPNTPWAVALMRAQNGEEIAYHLGKNIKEVQRIASLEPVDQFIEIGLLSAKLAQEPQKPKTPSKAPEPIKPLSGTAPAETGPSEQDDMKTWFKKRQHQVHGTRR